MLICAHCRQATSCFQRSRSAAERQGAAEGDFPTPQLLTRRKVSALAKFFLFVPGNRNKAACIFSAKQSSGCILLR